MTDDPSITTGQAISRDEGARVAALQDAYIAERDMVIVDGFIGNDPEYRSRARLYIETANANIAGICSERRNVVGMMPHPERACEPMLGSGDGLILFESVVGALSAHGALRSA